LPVTNLLNILFQKKAIFIVTDTKTSYIRVLCDTCDLA